MHPDAPVADAFAYDKGRTEGSALIARSLDALCDLFTGPSLSTYAEKCKLHSLCTYLFKSYDHVFQIVPINNVFTLIGYA